MQYIATQYNAVQAFNLTSLFVEGTILNNMQYHMHMDIYLDIDRAPAWKKVSGVWSMCSSLLYHNLVKKRMFGQCFSKLLVSENTSNEFSKKC